MPLCISRHSAIDSNDCSCCCCYCCDAYFLLKNSNNNNSYEFHDDAGPTFLITYFPSMTLFTSNKHVVHFPYQKLRQRRFPPPHINIISDQEKFRLMEQEHYAKKCLSQPDKSVIVTNEQQQQMHYPTEEKMVQTERPGYSLTQKFISLYKEKKPFQVGNVQVMSLGSSGIFQQKHVQTTLTNSAINVLQKATQPLQNTMQRKSSHTNEINIVPPSSFKNTYNASSQTEIPSCRKAIQTISLSHVPKNIRSKFLKLRRQYLPGINIVDSLGARDWCGVTEESWMIHKSQSSTSNSEYEQVAVEVEDVGHEEGFQEAVREALQTISGHFTKKPLGPGEREDIIEKHELIAGGDICSLPSSSVLAAGKETPIMTVQKRAGSKSDLFIQDLPWSQQGTLARLKSGSNDQSSNSIGQLESSNGFPRSFSSRDLSNAQMSSPRRSLQRLDSILGLQNTNEVVFKIQRTDSGTIIEEEEAIEELHPSSLNQRPRLFSKAAVKNQPLKQQQTLSGQLASSERRRASSPGSVGRVDFFKGSGDAQDIASHMFRSSLSLSPRSGAKIKK